MTSRDSLQTTDRNEGVNRDREMPEPITHLFDAVHQLWDHRRTQRAFLP